MIRARARVYPAMRACDGDGDGDGQSPPLCSILRHIYE